MAIKPNLLARSGAHQPLLLMGLRGSTLIIKFVMTLFVANYMGFEDLGLYGLITAASIVVAQLLGLGLMTVHGRHAVTQDKDQVTHSLYYYGRYVLLIYGIIFFTTLIIGAFSHKLILFTLIAGVLFLEHLNFDIYNLLLNLSQPFTANILHFIRSGLWMLVFMAIGYNYADVRSMEVLLFSWILGSSAALIIFAGIIYGWPWKRDEYSSTLKQWIIASFSESRTIYLSGLVQTARVYLNHFLVTLFLGLEMTGVYVFFMQVPGALSNLIQTGIIQTTRPKLVRAYKMGDQTYSDIYTRYQKNTVLVAMTMAIIAIPVMYILTKYVIDRPLAVQWFPIFYFIMTQFVLSMLFLFNDLVFYSQHKDSLTMKVNSVGLAAATSLNLILLPLFALWGAVAVSIIVSSFLLIVQRRYIRTLLVV